MPFLVVNTKDSFLAFRVLPELKKEIYEIVTK